jgi:AcrR family transcriptional regulator
MADPGEVARRPRVRNARPKIERAALQLFVEEGVDAATTRSIAEQAGVSEGALYRHYKGKDEMALALFMETHNRLGTMMAEAFEQGGALEERVRRVVTAYCSLADEDWLLFSFHLLSMHRYLPHDIRRDDDPVSITERLIRGLMKEGEIPEGDPALLAAMSLGVMTQAGQNKAYSRLPGPFSAHIPAFTRAIIAILKQA